MAKKKASTRKGAAAKSRKDVRLIVSDESSPTVTVSPGMKFEVVTVTVVEEESMEEVALGARLCGGTSTCLALVETE